jgi:glycosyltransferase involved in cell wall biosynthesis
MRSPTRPSIAGARVAVIQPLLPHYRVPVFDLLARSTGIELTVVCDTDPKGSLKGVPPSEAFRCEHAALTQLGPAISQRAMLRVAASRRFDAAVFTWNTRIIELVPALVTCRATRKGSVLWGHGYSKQDSPLRRSTRRAILAFPDAALLYGHAERSKLVEAGWDPSRIFVAPNAIDQSPIEQAKKAWISDPARLAEWQRTNGLKQDRLIVFISRVEADKRVDLLLEALAHLASRGRDLRLAVIGGGTQLDAAKGLASRLGLSDRVTFTGPIYDEASIAPWCLSACCLAYPEAVGLSIYHAFGYGLPVVTSDDIPSHNPEIESLVPGVNGLLYAHRDTSAFARAIESIVDDPRGREGWRSAALETVQRPDGYNLGAMVDGYARALAHALHRASRAAT